MIGATAADFQRFAPESADEIVGKRIPSHDFGMVGFVKYLVDEVAGSASAQAQRRRSLGRTDWNRCMSHKEMVVLKKTS
jgi:hypothetical protein